MFFFKKIYSDIKIAIKESIIVTVGSVFFAFSSKYFPKNVPRKIMLAICITCDEKTR